MKNVFWVFCMFFFLQVGFSQKSVAVLEGGFKAGLSIPSLTSGSISNPISSGYGSRLALDAALFVEFHLNTRWSLQTQLEYSSQGGKKKGMQALAVPDQIRALLPETQVPDLVYARYESEAKINYLMLPVLAKLNIPINQQWIAYAGAGPFVSVLLHAVNVTKGSSPIFADVQGTRPLVNSPFPFDNEKNITDDLHRVNFGAGAIAGIKYQMQTRCLFLETGGNYGFLNIQKNNLNGSNRTGSAVVVLGYQHTIF